MDPYFGLGPVRGGDADVERFVVFEAVDMHGRRAVVFRSHANRGVEEMLDRARTEAQCAVPDTHYRGWGSDPSIRVFAVSMGTVRWTGLRGGGGGASHSLETTAHLTVKACRLPELPGPEREPLAWQCQDPGALADMEPVARMLLQRVALVKVTMGIVRFENGLLQEPMEYSYHRRPILGSSASFTSSPEPQPEPQGAGWCPPPHSRSRT